MLQPRKSRLSWKMFRLMAPVTLRTITKCHALTLLLIINIFVPPPFALTQYVDDPHVVRPTPVLQVEDKDLTTVVLLNNDNGYSDYHGRFLNVKPEVGLLTFTARTFIQEGVTTEYATQVVGTTLENGRIYAQYLKKSSRVLFENEPQQLTPSVVTSWVGEYFNTAVALQSKSLPQSHNDLINAEKPDWQDIDDRLLLERNAFIGNTDFGGLNEIKKHTGNFVISSVITSSSEAAFMSTQSASSSYSFPINVEMVSVNKVLPIDNLPTYTVLNNFQPSGRSTDSSPFGDKLLQISHQKSTSFSGAASRSPKLYYQQVIGGTHAVTAANVPSGDIQKSLPSRVLSTITYYGFADFTTIVGDSIIVFSPSTSSHSLKLGQVTSIKGEATLDGFKAYMPNVPIANTKDIIEPTYTDQTIVPTIANDELKVPQNGYIKYVAEKLHETTTTFNLNIGSKSIIQNVMDDANNKLIQLETSEVAGVVASYTMLSETENNNETSKESKISKTVMFSRPSDQEISEIYSLLASAETANNLSAVKSESTVYEKTPEETDDLISMMTKNTVVDLERVTESSNPSSVQILGGATTIFFEDDPFANFVESTSTKDFEMGTSSTTMTTYVTKTKNPSDSLYGSNSLSYSNELNTMKTDVTETIIKPKIDNIAATNIADSTLFFTKQQNSNDINQVTEEEYSTTDQNAFADIIIKEIKNDNYFTETNCVRTSQVFLTQLPKTLTYFTTILITHNDDDIKTTSSSIETNIVPTFEITQATKHYCIQPSIVVQQTNTPPQQLEKPLLHNTDETNIESESTTIEMEENSTTTNDNIQLKHQYIEDSTTMDYGTNMIDKDDQKESTVAVDTEKEVLETEDDSTARESDYEDDADISAESSDDDSTEEIELIYKTLYTTYTYLTTFFHEETSSISSHTEVVTNIQTLPVESSMETTLQNANEIAPTSSTTVRVDSTSSRFFVPSELESIIREGEYDHSKKSSPLTTEVLSTARMNEKILTQTYYTTYTYYTTIFEEGETEIMSRTEVYTNHVTSQLTPTKSLVDDSFASTTVYDMNNIVDLNSSLINSSTGAMEYSSITLVTDVRSSTSNGEKHVINNKTIKIHEPPIDDQISLESNTDETLPSATLLLQTSFTTFTYYTTMYSGDNTNVVSRLETVTNLVTETLQPTKSINLEEVTLPITFFTTFTYWTKLAKDGEISTISREETISNVITPSNDLSPTENIEPDTFTKSSVVSPVTLMSDFVSASVIQSSIDRNIDNNASETFYVVEDSIDNAMLVTSILEPTTYYTTYTYYTTSYETDKAITDSRFETITNVVIPTGTYTDNSSPKTSLSVPNADMDLNLSDPNIILYDYKKIIDADGISTLHFTTQVLSTTGEDNMPSELVSSTSSLFIDEVKKALLPTTTTPLSLSSDGSTSTLRQYKTGLVRLIEGTRIENRTTTLYQSKVIGTIIDNRYAQIIESTSSFLFESGTISPSTTQGIFQATQLNTLQVESNSNAPVNVESSIIESNDENIEQTEDGDEESDDDTDSKGHSPFQSRKRTFTPVIRPFASRNRPQFAPKKKNITPSSATIITRSDFTPTITATPAIKSSGRFSSSRKNISVSSLPISGSIGISSKRFSRPSKASIGSNSVFGSSGSPTASTAPGAARNRFASSRISGVSSSRRPTSPLRLSSSVGFRGGFSTGYTGNSRGRIKPTASPGFSAQISSSSDSFTTLISENSEEEENSTQSGQLNEEVEDESVTESSRRNSNPLLRFRRPLNRPSGFTSANGQRPATGPSSSNSPVTARRNPLSTRPKSATTSTSTTTTTNRPRPRSFQRPAISSFQSRSRPQSSLFPPRNLFQAQEQITDNRSEDETVEGAEDDSEYEDDDDEEGEENVDDNVNRRRRSNTKTGKNQSVSQTAEIKVSKTDISPIKHLKRIRREAETSLKTRTNFRNRFRRPRLPATAEERIFEEDIEYETSPIPATSARSRLSTRFSGRYQNPNSHHITSTETAPPTTVNHRAIRPTRPTSGRAQFTLREKDMQTTTQKGLMRKGTSNFRRPQTAASSRRSPSPTVGGRRLKSYTSTNSASDSSSRNPPVRSRNGNVGSSSRSRGSSVRGRNRNDYNADPVIPNFDGTITVTHIIPAEVTIPVVNGKVTEYKNVITAKTSTEVLNPQQYTTYVGANGQTMLALTREESNINFAGATEITQFVLHESSTTKVTFTPTTIRGRKTSFSHIIPSTIYSVENVVSTAQQQIAANAPLANILLSQLLLGNIGLPTNPLLEALGGATQPSQLAAAIGSQMHATPVTEFRTHSSTYVTTLFEGTSTILPITFQGKKILTTIYDTTAQTITATEFVTDTIVTTPTQQPQPAQVNSLLLHQLLQQQLQPQEQPKLPILHSAPPKLFLSENLQELETNSIRIANERNDLIEDIPLVEEAQSNKSGRKKSGRKSGKTHKRNKQHDLENVAQESFSVITLYVSGRRPGEFSTILSTVQASSDSTLQKREAYVPQVLQTVDIGLHDYYISDGSEIINKYLLPEDHTKSINVDSSQSNEAQLDANVVVYEDGKEQQQQTQSLESIVGDISLWYAMSTTQLNFKTKEYTREIDTISSTTSKTIRKEDNRFPTTVAASIAIIANVTRHFHQNLFLDVSTINERRDIKKEEYDKSGVLQSNQHYSTESLDEARYNLETRIMSNGVEVIIASDKSKTTDHNLSSLKYSISRIVPIQVHKPMTLAPSTIKNQMSLVMPSNAQTNLTVPINTNQFITKTCLTTYTYRTTYLQDGHTTVESREKVISNIAIEDRNYLNITSALSLGVTLTRMPELVIGVFPTTYSYYNTFLDGELPLVFTSAHTVINTITQPDDISNLQPSEELLAVYNTNTYYSKITLTKKITDAEIQKIVTTTNVLTQVIITESLPARGITSQTASHNQITEPPADSYDLRIYATKTFLTTFTYFVTSLKRSNENIAPTQALQKSSTSDSSTSTLLNYHTRIIENIVTDTVANSLLRPELVASLRTELEKRKNDQRIIVTIATLIGGKMLEITATKMIKSSISKTSNELLEDDPLSVSTLSPHKNICIYESTEIPLNSTITSVYDQNRLPESKLQIKAPNSQEIPMNAQHVVAGETDNGVASSEQHSVYDTLPPLVSIEQNKPQLTKDDNAIINSTNLNLNNYAISTKHPISMNHIIDSIHINQFTVLRPVLDAMAGLLQSNFVTVTNPQSIKSIQIQSKGKHTTKNMAANSSYGNALSGNTKHSERPIYIPVKNDIKYMQHSASHKKYDGTEDYVFKLGKISPQSLHIQPPATVDIIAEGNWLHVNKNQNIMTNQLEHQYKENVYNRHKQTLYEPSHLLNGGIPIRPGEIITANSDLIIGKLNGMQYPRVPYDNPGSYQPDTVIPYLGDTLPLPMRIMLPPPASSQKISFHQHVMQYPYHNKVSPAGSENIIPLKDPYRNDGEAPTSPIENFGDILKPPPLLYFIESKVNSYKRKPTQAMQGLLPPSPARQQYVLDSEQYQNPIQLSTNSKSQPPKIYNENNEFQTNEILEIKRIPEIYSTDLPAAEYSFNNYKNTAGTPSHYQTHQMNISSDKVFKEYNTQNKVQKPHKYNKHAHSNMSFLIEATNFVTSYATTSKPLKLLQHPKTHSSHQHINLDTNVLSHNVDMNAPPLTFKKEASYPPHSNAVRGQIQSGFAVDTHVPIMYANMPHVKITMEQEHVQVNLTPQHHIINSIDNPLILEHSNYDRSNDNSHAVIGSFVVLQNQANENNRFKPTNKYSDDRNKQYHPQNNKDQNIADYGKSVLKIPNFLPRLKPLTTKIVNELNISSTTSKNIIPSKVAHSMYRNLNNKLFEFAAKSVEYEDPWEINYDNDIVSKNTKNTDQKTSSSTNNLHRPHSYKPMHRVASVGWNKQNLMMYPYIPTNVSPDVNTTSTLVKSTTTTDRNFVIELSKSVASSGLDTLTKTQTYFNMGSSFIHPNSFTQNKNSDSKTKPKSTYNNHHIFVVSEEGFKHSPSMSYDLAYSTSLMTNFIDIRLHSTTFSKDPSPQLTHGQSTDMHRRPPNYSDVNHLIQKTKYNTIQPSISTAVTLKTKTSQYNRSYTTSVEIRSLLPYPITHSQKTQSVLGLTSPPYPSSSSTYISSSLVASAAASASYKTNNYIAFQIFSSMNKQSLLSSPPLPPDDVKKYANSSASRSEKKKITTDRGRRPLQTSFPGQNYNSQQHLGVIKNLLNVHLSTSLSISTPIPASTSNYNNSSTITSIAADTNVLKNNDSSINSEKLLIYIGATQMRSSGIVPTIRSVVPIQINQLTPTSSKPVSTRETATTFDRNQYEILLEPSEANPQNHQHQLLPIAVASIETVNTVIENTTSHVSISEPNYKNDVEIYEYDATSNKNIFIQNTQKPSITVVLTDITAIDKQQHETNLMEQNNSIFVVMSNANSNGVISNKGGNFSFVPNLKDQVTPHKNMIIKFPTDPGLSNTHDTIELSYDDSITFDDDDIIARDEEFTTSHDARKTNLLSGVLVASPPRSNNIPIKNVNTDMDGGVKTTEAEGKVSCWPACKSSRNELCGLLESRLVCVCRPGFARMFPDRPCKPTYTYAMKIHAHRIGNYKLLYDDKLANNNSDDFRHLTSIAHDAVDRMIMQSDFRDVYHGVQLMSFEADAKTNRNTLLVNFLLQLSDNSDEKRLENVFKKYLRLSNYSIGSTELFTNKNGVESLTIVDFDECVHSQFHDCSKNSRCFNLQGTYTCSCQEGYADLSENTIYPGRICTAEMFGCENCHYNGKCVEMVETSKPDRDQSDVTHCKCFAWYTGTSCQLNLKIFLITLVAIGMSLSVVLFFCILLTCTNRWKQHNVAFMHTSATPSSAFTDIHKISANKTRSTASSKSKNIEKRAFLKDSSSETSQNSLIYVLKKESTAYSSKQKKFNNLNRSRNNICLDFQQQHDNHHRTYDSLIVNSIKNTGTPLPHSFKELEQHYPDQSDRSLTVMIPRAKYHYRSVLPQTELLHHQLTMERMDKQKKSKSSTNGVATPHSNDDVTTHEHITSMSSTPSAKNCTASSGALVSAGFEVSAKVNGNLLISSNGSLSCRSTNFGHSIFNGLNDVLTANVNIARGETTKDLSTNVKNTADKDRCGKTPISNLRNEIHHKTIFSACLESDHINIIDNEDLIDSMDVWLDNIPQN